MTMHSATVEILDRKKWITLLTTPREDFPFKFNVRINNRNTKGGRIDIAYSTKDEPRGVNYILKNHTLDKDSEIYMENVKLPAEATLIFRTNRRTIFVTIEVINVNQG